MRHAPASLHKILVADDDRATRFAISSMLKKGGYTVTVASNGAEALRKDRKSTRLNSSHSGESRMPSSA